MNDHPSRVTGVFLDEQAHEAVLLIDGENYRITEADFRTLGFSEGDWLGDGELEAVCKAAERLRCIRKAMDCLSYGDMSGKKLLGKLTPVLTESWRHRLSSCCASAAMWTTRR